MRLIRAVRRWWAVSATVALLVSGVWAGEEDGEAAYAEDEWLEESDESGGLFGDLDGVIGGTFGGAVVNGSTAAMQARTGYPRGVFGGIDELALGGYVGEEWELASLLRAVPGLEDYELDLALSEPDGLYFDLKFDRYRTWYNGAGGWLPRNNTFYQLADPELHIDRDFLDLEIGYRGWEDWEVYGRFSRATRRGEKDSTIWGDVAVPWSGWPRSVVPGLLEVDEARNIFELGASWRGEKTEVEGKVFFESSEYSNTTRTSEDSGNRKVTQRENYDADLFSAFAAGRHEFSERVLMTTAASYTEIKTDTGGNRVYGAAFDVPYDPMFINYGSKGAGFLDLFGNSDWRQYLYRLNFMIRPNDRFTIVPSLGLEKVDQSARTSYLGVANYQRDYGGYSEDEFDRIDLEVEARYRPSRAVFLYSRGRFAREDGDMSEFLAAEQLVPWVFNSTALDYAAAYERTNYQFEIGADLKPSSRLVFSLQAYFREQENEYDVGRDIKNDPVRAIPRGDYPGYIRRHERETWDANARMTWRPRANLSSVTRVDYQWIPVYSTAFTGGEVTSAEAESLIVSEALTWIPKPGMLLQVYGSYVQDHVETPANGFNANPWLPGAGLEVLESKNDYWTAGIHAAFELEDDASLDLGYSYFRSANFRDHSAFSVPYGSSVEEHFVSARYTRWLRDNLLWTLEGGVFHSSDDGSGGNNDFTSYVLSSGLQCRF
jgi:hypothetical protein